MTKTQNTSSTTINKARLNPGRQWVGIRNLEFIEEVQPRAGLDRGWVNDLSKFRLEGSEFPPIKVFQTPDGRLIPGEGHHRSMAMSSAGEDQILCDVVDGTMEDAIVYAAGSNRSNGVKPMGPKDITKAVEMLLAIDEWWSRSDSMIAEHVGCSKAKASSIRSKVAIRDNKTIPDVITNQDGVKRTYHPRRGTNARRISEFKVGNRTIFSASYGGKSYRGASRQVVEQKLEAAIRSKPIRLLSNANGARSFFQRLGFEGLFIDVGTAWPGLSGRYRPGMLCLYCDFSSSESLPLTIGRLIAARRYKGDLTARMVVLCYPEDGPAKVIDLYRQEGFEFLTPEELAESLKALKSGEPSSPV